MKKATVTYTAPPKESKVLDIGGTTLLSGKPDTVICDDALMARLVAAAAPKGSMLVVEGVVDYDGDEPPKDTKKGKPA